jgi:hypothetical protein
MRPDPALTVAGAAAASPARYLPSRLTALPVEPSGCKTFRHRQERAHDKSRPAAGQSAEIRISARQKNGSAVYPVKQLMWNIEKTFQIVSCEYL